MAKISIKENELKGIISEAIQSNLDEGIEFDPSTRTVSYNPSNDDIVDTSIDNNPTMDGSIVPGIEVWSIFKRKRGAKGSGDGNPLVYALKGEGWTFRSEADKEAIEQQFSKIASKFAAMYRVGITVLMPSGNELNNRIANVILSKSPNAELIEGAICKLTTEEVDDIVLRFDSKFREAYKDDFNTAYWELKGYLELMNDEREGYFSRHMIKNGKMRDILDFTFKVSPDRFAKYANKINGQNILILDDTISRGQSIREACRVIQDSYAPKSITVLTLLSRAY